MIEVAVLGAGGKMGRTVCRAVDTAEDLELVAAVDPAAAGKLLGEIVPGLGAGSAGLVVLGSVEDLGSSVMPRVAVDFTVAEAAVANLLWCAVHGVHGVCGTTGVGEGAVSEIGGAFEASEANLVLVPNFSIGAVLMMRCAELCAPFFSGVEIVELHHEKKVDAPSGTALATARRIEASRASRASMALAPDPTRNEAVAGARGGAVDSGLRVHSVRLPGLVAHHEVLFGAAGETLTIRHDSLDRESFMAGVLLAVRKVGELAGVTVGLEGLLGI